MASCQKPRLLPAFLHCVADHGEGFFAGLAVRRDIVGAIEVAPVDLVDGHELINIKRVGALDLDGLDLLGLDLDVLALGDLIPAGLIFFIDDLARDLVHHLLAKAVASLAVYLMKVRLFGLARGAV
jgi:hypothetical protein